MSDHASAAATVRLAVAGAILALTFASCGGGSPGGSGARRAADGVIVLTFDALRADALGAYGNPRRTSPALDAFAAESWLYERAYSAAPITWASFVAMFTGRYPKKSAAGWRIETGPTVAELFSGLGFRTAGFFANPWLQRNFGFARGFERFELRSGHDAEVLGRALAWTKAHRHDRFFLWIHLLVPHMPWLRHAEAEHLYDAGYRGEFLDRVPPLVTIDDAAALARAKDLYAGEVFHADRLFHRFWRALGRLGLRDRVAVVVSADHGEELMGHGYLQHGQLYDENLHVPLLVRPPGGRARRIATPVGTVDLLPTLLDLAGRTASGGTGERSLLAEPIAARPLLAVAERRSIAARVGSLKLILSCEPPERRQLYDLAVDPAEQRDLAPARADAVREIEGVVWHALGARGCADYVLPGGPHGDDVDEKTRHALEALGYLRDDAHR